MEPKNHFELTKYFIDAGNKLAISSEVSVELPNINTSNNSGSEREAIFF